MHMDTGFSGDGLFLLLGLLPFVFYVIILAFTIYFAVKVIRFINKKSKLDEERNAQLAELIQVLKQNKEN